MSIDAISYLVAVLILAAGLLFSGYYLGTIRSRPRKAIPHRFPFKEWEEWAYRPLDRRVSR